MFEGWHDFYLVLGPASAGLIGLLFVVVTLTTNLEREKAMRGVSVFMTPIVFHLGVLVLLSGLALFPKVADDLIGAVAFAGGLVGLAYAVYVCWAFLSKTVESYEGDLLRYGLGVGALYVGLVAAGALILFGVAMGPYVLAVDQLALFLLMVNNAWDLVVFITPRKDDPTPPSGG
ncbi:MAG: hypothetical protein ACXWK7_12840 [Caulobacteraceae bacterium]